MRVKPIFPPFTPDSLIRRVSRERVLLLGGASAVCLQVAHPQVARGVAHHSGFRKHPIRRLHSTLDATYSIVFGSTQEIEHVKRRVAARHAPVHGAGYSAFDPGAQLWVLSTLIFCGISLFERFVSKLTLTEKDRLLAEYAGFGSVFGMETDTVPANWPAFIGYWESMMNGELLGSDALCAEVAMAVVCPQKPFLLKWGSSGLRTLAAGLIPDPLLDRLGIRPPDWSATLWRWLDRVLPGLLRRMPARLRYEWRSLRPSHLH